MPLPKVQNFTAEDYWSLSDGQRAELINGQLYDGALEKKDFQYPLVNLYCRGWDSTVSMVDIPVWNVVKQIHFNEPGNNANLKVYTDEVKNIILPDGMVSGVIE